MSEFFTQIADFIGTRWAELLALVGGASGIATICIILGRVLVSLFVAKIQKKNNIPVNESVSQLQAEIKALRDDLNTIKQELPNVMSEATKKVLTAKNKAKRKAYSKIVEGKEIIEEKVQEIEPVVEEVQEKVQEKVQEVKKELDDTVKVVIKSE